MRVLCIDDDFEAICYILVSTPKIGEVYSVIKESRSDDGLLMYKLAEFPNGTKMEFLWDADAFVPISNIDETEMVRNYNIKKVIA